MKKGKIWIGYSGGLDSTVLLHIVSKYYADVHAIHVNHNLSVNAEKWQKQCKYVCKKLGVPISCVRVNALPVEGQSPEEAARVARYKACYELMGADDVLLTAHHADDQAETILYRLMRGTGPKGLGGMQARSNIYGIQILRPMLELTREEILGYAKNHKLSYICDESNKNISFDRNFIRHKIMPLLKERWGAVVTNIMRAGQLCKEVQTNIDVPEILDLNFWLRESLRVWLLKQGLQPSLEHLNTIIKQVINARHDAQPQFKLGNKVICRYQNKLFALDEGKLNYSKAHGRKVKKIFQQNGVPPWERGEYELVHEDGRLIEITGLWRLSQSDKVKSRV